MKNITNKIGKMLFGSLLFGGFGMGMTSCNEFLEVKPLNEICVDNYWDEKADVTSVVMGCYSGLQDDDCLKRMYIWGESRSEDVIFRRTGDGDLDLRQICEENILETNKYMSWVSLYKVINRCNTVIHYAPIVAEIDPNYTDSEVRANIAEVTFIRSLCYFYLARTFRDVPYSTKPSMDDNDIDGDYRIAPTPFKDLLAQLAKDLEDVKGDAIRYYPPMRSTDTRISNPYNTSRVTVCAINALLCDLYLWLDEYQKCIDCAQAVIDYKMTTYEDVKDEYPTKVREIKVYNNKYPLIEERYNGGDQAGQSFYLNFGEGNSFESIFELYFEQQRSKENAVANTFFYNTRDNGLLYVPSYLTAGVSDNTSKYFKYTDSRAYQNFMTASVDMVVSKFYYDSWDYIPPKTSGTTVSGSYSSRDRYQNWIFYRLTDVLLMAAEAHAELGGDENLQTAFELVSVVYNRANNLEESSSQAMKFDDYNDQEKMRQLVREERHRELMFEGKRWYEWVRYCLRKGSVDELIAAVTDKHDKLASKVSIQLRMDGALFWPYAEREVDLNSHLVQNTAFTVTETSAK